MSHFYASIQGNRGEATRTGARDIFGHIRGWKAGVEVQGMVYGEQGDAQDGFRIYMTAGSGGSGHRTYIGTVWSANGQDPYFEPATEGLH